ncbi:MAG: DoxX family membrane protein [Acidobacteria bacterium]|nr:DoxX family membrane protein [Acidobacteriota bacterium]
MDAVLLFGRLIFGGYFLWNGLGHYLQTSMLVGYAASKGVPAPEVAVMGSGLLLLAGGASMLLGLWPRIGLSLIIVFLIGVSFPMHDFWAIADPGQRMADMINFTKNMALVGASLMMMAIPEPWAYSLGRRRVVV